MSYTESQSLREYLKEKDEKLADKLNNLWQISEKIHERQNRPDSNENGKVHVEKVAQNIWRLINSPLISNNSRNHLDKLSAFEIFILSSAACCHDFDKALKSALPDGFEHGRGSGEFVFKNREKFGLSRTEAEAIEKVVSLHDLKSEGFIKGIKKIRRSETGPDGKYNSQLLALLLKTADILHCDNTRVLTLGIDADKFEGLDRKKYLFRDCTKGWEADGTRIIIGVSPGTDEEKRAANECFTFMKHKEWTAVADLLEQNDFPYLLEPEADLQGDDTVLIHDYLKAVIRETHRIDIKGIFSRSGAGREAIHFPVEEIYTPLTTRNIRYDMHTLDKEMLKHVPGEDNVTLTSLLSKEKKLLIVGEPGGGKTTFLKLVASVLAKDVVGRSDGEPGREKVLGLSLTKEAPVPVFLRLAGLADLIKKETISTGPGNSWKWIIHAVEQIFSKEESYIIQKLLEKGRCALLLDGLDEVADESTRNQIADIVNSVIGRFPDNLFIISSRPFGYNDISDIKEIKTVHIDAFREKEIVEFLNRWGQGLSASDDSKGMDTYISELKSAIIDYASIRSLAKNPVMLTCLCVVHWNEKRLPEGKADLLAAVLRWLLNAREKIRNKRGMTNTFAEECFKTLAMAMTCHTDGKKAMVDLAWTGQYRLNLLTQNIIGTIKEDDLLSRAKVVGVLGRLLKILKVYEYTPPKAVEME
jgi:hypothetical protein